MTCGVYQLGCREFADVPRCTLKDFDKRDSSIEEDIKVKKDLYKNVCNVSPLGCQQPCIELEDRNFGDEDHRPIQNLLHIDQLEFRKPVYNSSVLVQSATFRRKCGGVTYLCPSYGMD